MKHLLPILLVLAFGITSASPVKSNLGGDGENYTANNTIVPIEYLESSGVQWIKTDIIDDPGANRIEITFMRTINNPSLMQLYGSTAAYFNYIVINGGNRQYQFGINGNMTPKLPTLLNTVHFGTYQISDNACTFSLDGRIGLYTGSSSHKLDIPLTIFSITGSESRAPFIGRIYSVRIVSQSTGETRNNLIAVRIGDEGFLYDTLSDSLYGNSGTGSFVLGPDIAPLEL